jgi:hypothetical protein
LKFSGIYTARSEKVAFHFQITQCQIGSFTCAADIPASSFISIMSPQAPALKGAAESATKKQLNN